MPETLPPDPPFRFKPLPVLLVLLLGLGLPYLGAYLSQGLSHVLPLPSMQSLTLYWLYSQHASQTLFALIAIAVIRIFVPFDAGLRWPPQRSYIPAAVLWGLFFGVLMTVVDYLPDLMARHPPDPGFPLTPANIVGWLGFEGIYVGPTEEILFRSLLVGYLIAAMPGKFSLGRYSMSWAGVIVAVVFALAHAGNVIMHPSFATIGQQFYAAALGILYAYWFEKSRSVVAPIIGHNVGDVSEYAIVFLLNFIWR